MNTWIVSFNNGTSKRFTGYGLALLKAIDTYCTTSGLITVSFTVERQARERLFFIHKNLTQEGRPHYVKS